MLWSLPMPVLGGICVYYLLNLTFNQDWVLTALEGLYHYRGTNMPCACECIYTFCLYMYTYTPYTTYIYHLFAAPLCLIPFHVSSVSLTRFLYAKIGSTIPAFLPCLPAFMPHLLTPLFFSLYAVAYGNWKQCANCTCSYARFKHASPCTLPWQDSTLCMLPLPFPIHYLMYIYTLYMYIHTWRLESPDMPVCIYIT